MEFIRASPEHDDIVVVHYLAIGHRCGNPSEHLRPSSDGIIHGFLETGREKHELASFIAFDGKTRLARCRAG
jgi:hypothetical protein